MELSLHVTSFVGSLLLVGLVAGSCPDINTGVNCSFETGDSCLKHYEKIDKHGLKWASKSGSIASSQTNNQGVYGHYGYHYTPPALQSSPKGQYLYLPGTNDTRAHGLWTDLVSPPVTVGSTGCLYFLFHNNVCGEDNHLSETAFKVFLRPDSRHRVGIQNNAEDILLREYPCIDSNEWYNTKLPIFANSGIYRVLFSAKQHEDIDQIVAVDRIIYSDRSCSVRDDRAYREGDCDFEDSCGYTQSKSTGTPLTWRPVMMDMVVDKNVESSSPQGFFLALWGEDNRDGPDVAHAKIHTQSPQINIRDKGCLSVTYYCGRYFRQNDDVTALVVSKDNGSNILYEFPATLGKEPIKAFVNLPAGQYSIRFTASVKPPFGESPNDFIALDDIEIHQKSCDDVRCESEVCEPSSIFGTGLGLLKCNNGGTCVGRGLVHNTCDCRVNYIGKSCEINTERAPTTQPATRPYWYGRRK